MDKQYTVITNHIGHCMRWNVEATSLLAAKDAAMKLAIRYDEEARNLFNTSPNIEFVFEGILKAATE